jgi:hypothetical protein
MNDGIQQWLSTESSFCLLEYIVIQLKLNAYLSKLVDIDTLKDLLCFDVEEF